MNNNITINVLIVTDSSDIFNRVKSHISDGLVLFNIDCKIHQYGNNNLIYHLKVYNIVYFDNTIRCNDIFDLDSLFLANHFKNSLKINIMSEIPSSIKIIFEDSTLILNKLMNSSYLLKHFNYVSNYLLKNFIFIKEKKNSISISLDNIIFIEKKGHYCYIYTYDRTYKTRQTISNLFETLNTRITFHVILRSYIVNLTHTCFTNEETLYIKILDKNIYLSTRQRKKLINGL